MNLKPHADSGRLAEGLEKCLAWAVPFERDVCRWSRMRYATVKKLVDGEGAKLCGGRWNPPGINAVYCSLDIGTVTAELTQRHRRGGIPMNQMAPHVLVFMHIKLDRVLDLMQKWVFNALNLVVNRFWEEWKDKIDGDEETITQAIGRLAWKRQLDGLLVPSVPGRPFGVNLVAFPEHAPKGWCEIYKKDELRR